MKGCQVEDSENTGRSYIEKPIVAYLKYIVKQGNNRIKATMNAASIIFIEEPEAHLHPLNQIKLMKSFTRLAKSNVKLVMA